MVAMGGQIAERVSWIIRLAACTMLLCAAGCYDQMFPPVICNGYSETVRVHASFTNQKTAFAMLPPKAAMPQREERLVLDALLIQDARGATLARYTDADFHARTLPNEVVAFWLVTTNGLFPVPAAKVREWAESILELECPPSAEDGR